MDDIVLTRRVAASPQRLYALATDLPNIATIIPQITRVEMLSPSAGGAFAVGTKWRETRKAMGATACIDLEVVACTPGREFAVTCVAQGCTYRSTFSFAPDADATLVTIRTAIRPGGFWAWLGASLTRGAMTKGLRGDLEALARAAEST